MPDSATELLDPPADEVTGVEINGVETEEAADEAVEVIAADLLIEEISIDGMCGVY